MMKKFAALLLVMAMLFPMAAVAEEEAQTVAAEKMFEGMWVTFPNDGFEMYFPAEWLQVEITEEMLAKGVYYVLADPNGACAMSIAWHALEEKLDIDALEAAMVAAYADKAARLNLGNVEAVCYHLPDSNALCFAFLDWVDQGLFTFAFSPADDQAVSILATLIMNTVRPVEIAE